MILIAISWNHAQEARNFKKHKPALDAFKINNSTIINIQMCKFAKENELYVSYFSVNFSSYLTLVLLILCV